MELEPTPVLLRSPGPLRHPLDAIAELLLGHTHARPELPALGELGEALIALAQGTKGKVLLPVRETPLEYALVRRGDDVLVSCYETASHPELLLLNRTIALTEALDIAAEAARGTGLLADSNVMAHIFGRLADALEHVEVRPHVPAPAVERSGGALEPVSDVPLAFGFTAQIPASVNSGERAQRADVHAMLFGGTLVASVEGRRVILARGPILLTTQRLVSAARALMDASAADRTVHARLRAGAFHVAVRRERDGAHLLTLGPEGRESITLSATDPSVLALPILRVASELCRALTSVDRAQVRNLRVRALRDEIRGVRRKLRDRMRVDGFVNRDPERFKTLAPSAPPEGAAEASPAQKQLRFGERWRVEIDELDASATFLCGDRVVIGTPRRTLAVSRDDGRVLWAKEGPSAASLMVGTTLVRVSPAGDVALADVLTGHTVAETQIRSAGAPIRAMRAGSQNTPPALILTEGPSRIVSIDVRTGELRWRWRARGTGPVHMTRAGRLLLVTSGDGCVHALDVTSGDTVWRASEEARFASRVTVVRDTAVATSGEPGAVRSAVYGFDLYSGERRWLRFLDGAPVSEARPAGTRVLVSHGLSRRATLLALDHGSGETLWEAPDPGVMNGAEVMTVDDLLVVNATSGKASALALASGEERWSRKVSNPATDDLPRRLEPVLRGGALFVPASRLKVLRPHSGEDVPCVLPSDLVPDFLRVDERGWVYVAEESGILAGYAPAPQLSLITGGR